MIFPLEDNSRARQMAANIPATSSEPSIKVTGQRIPGPPTSGRRTTRKKLESLLPPSFRLPKAKLHGWPCINKPPELTELDDYIPDRRDFSWDMSTDTLNDGFFADQYLFMLEQIYALMETSFAVGERVQPKGYSPWSIPPVIEGDTTFEQYAASVARADPLCLYLWDVLLLHNRDTQHFLTAVMNKMLHDHVFKTLLFGASEEQLKTLKAQDDALIDEEGFRRTHLRAEYVDMFLKGLAPPLFWKQVDELAITITRSFLPVLTWVRRTWVRAVPSLEAVHQQIHDLVSFAAWLAVCMRRSASIIEFDWPTPGERDLPSSNIQNFDEEVFKHAMHRVRNVAQAKGHEDPRHARVMIAIAPSAWRYTVYREGYRKVRLQQKRAVFYHGLRSDAEEKKELKYGLSEWASMQREARKGTKASTRRTSKLRGQLWELTLSVLLALVVWAVVHDWGRFLDTIDYMLKRYREFWA